MNNLELNQFRGTEHYYQHWTKILVFTDGIHYLAEKAGAYWLIDAIASYRRKEPFQVWMLKVKEDKSAVLTMQEDTGQPVKVRQVIPFTDFPLDEIKLWLIDGVLILPSEY